MIDSEKHLYSSVKTAIRTLKGRRRDQAAFFVAVSCFSGGFALAKLVPNLVAGKWIARLQIALYAIGAIALVYGVVRVWRLVNPPELASAKDRPSAIKGPMAFTESGRRVVSQARTRKRAAKAFGIGARG